MGTVNKLRLPVAILCVVSTVALWMGSGAGPATVAVMEPAVDGSSGFDKLAGMYDSETLWMVDRAYAAEASRSDDCIRAMGAANNTGFVDGSTVTVGALFPLTGNAGYYGAEATAITKMATADFNDYLAGLDASWRLEVDVRDTATDPPSALAAIEELHDIGVNTVIGPVTSANVEAVMAYANQNDMLVISPGSSAPELAVPGDNVYRLAPDDRGQSVALVKLLEDAGIGALVVVWRGDAYGDGVRDAVVGDFGGVIHGGIRYTPDTDHMGLEALLLTEQVREAIDTYGADRVAVLMVSFEESIDLASVSAMRPALDDVRWFAAESVAQYFSLTEDPVASAFAESVNLTAAGILLDRGGLYDDIGAALSENLGWQPSSLAYTAYDSVWLVGLAMIEANGADIGETLPCVVSGYDGAYAYSGFNEAGDLPPVNHAVLSVIGGQWVHVATHLADGNTIEDITGR